MMQQIEGRKPHGQPAMITLVPVRCDVVTSAGTLVLESGYTYAAYHIAS